MKKDGLIICDEEIKNDNEKIKKLPFRKIGKEIGNVKIANIVMVGVVLKLYGMDYSFLKDILKNVFKDEKLFDINFKAAQKCMDLVDKEYELEKGKNKNAMLINGNQSIALGAIAANCKFYTAYPMTPSTSIMEYLSSKMSETHIVVEQAEDEIAAINMAIGASYAGARSMTGTSGGGFSLMVEGIGFACIAEIPIVIVNVQRPGPATGLPTRTEQSDLKFVISAAQGEGERIVIALRNHEDAFWQTIRAFNLSDKYQLPVILLSDQYLADIKTTVNPFNLKNVKRETHIVINIEGQEYLRYKLTKSGISERIIPGKIPGVTIKIDSDEHNEKGHITESSEVRIKMVNKRRKKLELLKKELIEPEIIGKGYDIVLVGWGSTYYPLREAVDMLSKENINCQAILFGDIFPLPTKKILKIAGKAKFLINVEQNSTGQLAGLISETTQIKFSNSILKYDGRPISAKEIFNRVKEIID